MSGIASRQDGVGLIVGLVVVAVGPIKAPCLGLAANRSSGEQWVEACHCQQLVENCNAPRQESRQHDEAREAEDVLSAAITCALEH